MNNSYVIINKKICCFLSWIWTFGSGKNAVGATKLLQFGSSQQPADSVAGSQTLSILLLKTWNIISISLRADNTNSNNTIAYRCVVLWFWFAFPVYHELHLIIPFDRWGFWLHNFVLCRQPIKSPINWFNEQIWPLCR